MRLARWLVLACAIAVACTRPNPAVCCDSPDDCSAIGVHEMQRACEAGFVCTGHECVSSTCSTDDDCRGATPHCSAAGVCVECDTAEQCPSEKPTCDSVTKACRACEIDEDCDSGVCDAATGMCVAEADVLYVSPTGPDAGTCTRAQPCSIVQANAVADQTRNNIKLAPGSYTANIILTNKTLVLYGAGATIAGGNNSAFEVNDGARLRINGATVTAATGNSVIRCEGTAAASHTLELFRTTVDNTSTSLLANPCTLTVEESVLHTSNTSSYALTLVTPTVATFNRTRFVGNGTGISALGSPTVQITNSVFENMGIAANHGAFVGAGFDVSFSTLIDSVIECGAQAATGLTFDSSIVYWASSGPPADTLLNIPSCTSVKNSVISPNSQPAGATNVVLPPQLKDAAAHDYHLLATSPAIDRGDPASTNAVDFDGVQRPQGSQRDSGAFELKP